MLHAASGCDVTLTVSSMQPLQEHKMLFTCNHWCEAAASSPCSEAGCSRIITMPDMGLHLPVCDPRVFTIYPALTMLPSCFHQ